MRAVLHRVASARAVVDGVEVAAVGTGVVVLVGFGRDDTPADVDRLARKLANLRVLSEGDSFFERSVADAGAEVLTVSQVTLTADTGRGRRPNLSPAAPPELGRALYARLGAALATHGVRVAAVPFASRAHLHADHWGPLTLVLP